MKTRSQPLIPLARRSIDVIREREKLTGEDKWSFPGVRTKESPMSDVAVTAALRRLGYGKEEICPRGFRAMASTLLGDGVDVAK
jgi:integrase